MATKAERAARRARNKERWARGERWNGSDATAALPTPSNGNGGHSDTPHPLTPANGSARNNHWLSDRDSRAGAGISVSRAARVEAALPDAEGARVLRSRRAQAKLAEGPDQARALARPFAWPCRCAAPWPELHGGGGWWGYRPVICVKCGRDC